MGAWCVASEGVLLDAALAAARALRRDLEALLVAVDRGGRVPFDAQPERLEAVADEQVVADLVRDRNLLADRLRSARELVLRTVSMLGALELDRLEQLDTASRYVEFDVNALLGHRPLGLMTEPFNGRERHGRSFR